MVDKKLSVEFGDYVELHLTHKIYEGILLETPESEKGIVLIKLDNGYNIGFNKKDISEIKVIRKKKDFTEDKVELKKDLSKPNIAMIITGGTIASRYDSKTGGVKWLDSSESLFKFYPEIFEIANVSAVEIPFMKGSEDMDYKDWQKIARIAEKFLNDKNIDGIIVTHGTDTLHYTSSALSFFLGKVNKPVVLTYSQRSIDRASSDANLNLRCAALVAVSDLAEVVLVGHASSSDDFCYAIAGTKTRKMHSSRRDAFKPINKNPFAKVYSDRIEFLSSYNVKDKKKKVKADISFNDKIALIKFYPGQNPYILEYYLKNKYVGVIIEMTGLGHVATRGARNSWIKKLKEVISAGLIVCAVPQTIYGRLNPLVYSNGREILETGVIYLEDMLAETAWVKLGWVLGHENWASNKEGVRSKMLENVSYEINNKLEE